MFLSEKLKGSPSLLILSAQTLSNSIMDSLQFPVMTFSNAL